jgi:threonine/homoserine/homoserine lactone efflux protein
MVVNILAIFLTPDKNFLSQIPIMAVISGMYSYFSFSIYTIFGVFLQKFLSNPSYNRCFNILMAGILLVSFFITIF